MEKAMASMISNLKPQHLWRHFDEIRKIPHCSKHEKQLGDYVGSIADQHGLPYKRDEIGNIVIGKPAVSGHANGQPIVLQSHLDMVCEKNSDVAHNFSKDPLNIQIDKEWVTAKGTTLGADNGIGVAAELAVLEDKNLIHGPLELLFTVDEETGLNGASSLKSDFINGRILLNLDSEEEDTFSIGCAGGGDSEIYLPIQKKTKTEGISFKVSLTGLRGGHSGVDIHTGRGNAIQLLARILFQTCKYFDLISIEGGNKHNAIPREAVSVLMVKNNQIDQFTALLNKLLKEIQFEYKTIEKNISLKIEKLTNQKKEPMDDKIKIRFLSLLTALPHGVLAMSQEIPNLVETSNNLAIVRYIESGSIIHTSTRSSILSALEATRSKIEAIAILTGATIKHFEGYPAWTPNLKSPLLKQMKTLYKKLNNKEVKVMAVHAGLECGIIGEKYPGMDMISFGPDIKNPHSPDEKVHIGSVEKFWNLLSETLKAYS